MSNKLSQFTKAVKNECKFLLKHIHSVYTGSIYTYVYRNEFFCFYFIDSIDLRSVGFNASRNLSKWDQCS